MRPVGRSPCSAAPVEKATGRTPLASIPDASVNLQLHTSAQQNRITDWLILVVEELQADQRIAADTTSDWLFGQGDARSIHDQSNIPGRLGRVRAFDVVTEDQSGVQSGKHD